MYVLRQYPLYSISICLLDSFFFLPFELHSGFFFRFLSIVTLLSLCQMSKWRNHDTSKRANSYKGSNRMTKEKKNLWVTVYLENSEQQFSMIFWQLKRPNKHVSVYDSF